MPPIRKKRPNATLDNARVRPKPLEKLPGLAQSPKCAEIGQAVSKGKEKALPIINEPDTNLIESVETVEEISQRASIPHGVGESPKSPTTSSKPSDKALIVLTVLYLLYSSCTISSSFPLFVLFNTAPHLFSVILIILSAYHKICWKLWYLHDSVLHSASLGVYWYSRHTHTVITSPH